ncbi:serine protease inhibitor 28Dc-like isoform X3 [Wyeomyia smithii]|uniref:serine protease inhibitor 28Dc-like isoform X3 n=1 Tax=Wyeomyia smithii TaxID=174621 RepID=UPI002468014F|nr:serine protease inhibitor 28Dc-like isoform X3 [Wyeomyia smithii]
MRLKYMLGIILIAALHQSNCQRPHRFSEDSSQDNALDIVADSVTNLAQKISRVIVGDRSKTEIFSPVSIAGALSLLLLGSGGTTRTELMELMGFSNSTIRFTEIHKGFGKLFGELVSNNPSLKANVPWRENDTCNNVDYDDFTDSRSSFQKETKGRRHRRDADNAVEVDIGNGLFAQYGKMFDEKYQKLAEELYRSNMMLLNFSTSPQKSAAFINDWVRERTRGKIPEIVSQLDSDTMLVIANTLFFKGEWDEPFLKDGTKARKFFPNGPQEPGIDVPMMVHGGCFPYYFWKEADVRVLGIPYKRNYTMYIFMPNDSDRRKLNGLREKLSANNVNDIIAKMDIKTASIQFPKMHMINSFNLKQVFQQLGAFGIFDRSKSDLNRILAGPGAISRVDVTNLNDLLDFVDDSKESAQKKLLEMFPDCGTVIEKDVDSKQKCEKKLECRFGGETCLCCAKTFGFRKRRDAGEGLFVNEVIHKIDVVVNEKGTEGGAVTATLLDRITPQVNFRANGPFIMMIRDESTKLPLFYGSVYEPTS